MECLDRLELAARRVWIVLATRLGIRKTGLMKLRHEIRACEYEDVRVMWELLRRKGNDAVGYSAQRRGRGRAWSAFRWATQAPYRFCGTF